MEPSTQAGRLGGAFFVWKRGAGRVLKTDKRVRDEQHVFANVLRCGLSFG